MANINILNKLHDKTTKHIELDELCDAAHKYGQSMGGAFVTNISDRTSDSQLIAVYAATRSYTSNKTDVKGTIHHCIIEQTSKNYQGDGICIAFDDIDPLCEQLQNIKEEYETAKMEYDALLKKVDPVEIKTYEED